MKKVIPYAFTYFLVVFLNQGCSIPGNEKQTISEGEKLAKIYCTACHMETPPNLLDKSTWYVDVFPKMGPRLGMNKHSILHYPRLDASLQLNVPALKQEQWESIVEYYYENSPDTLPKQDFKLEPSTDSKTFLAYPFTDDLSSSSIITMIEIDTVQKCLFAGDGNYSTLFKFDYKGNLLDTLQLPSPPTAMRIDANYIEMTLAGILHPNNEDRGQIVRYANNEIFKPDKEKLVLDSLYRPVTSQYFDFNYDGLNDYLVCEYGNDIGRLSLYFATNDTRYENYIIENMAGSIMVKIHDFNYDGFMDIIALFAQGDEKIMIYYNDGKGNFRKNISRVARFPAVYGSMYIDIQDFNKDGHMDILYVNGDNFDFSQILKPYHGIRILENDGINNFNEKYFYPIYGAAKAETMDFDMDGDLDIIVSSNFADMNNNPERGIIYLENVGSYDYIPYSFEESAQNQWNTIDVADLDSDGDKDVVLGAMYLDNVLKIQKLETWDEVELNKSPLLILENKTY